MTEIESVASVHFVAPKTRADIPFALQDNLYLFEEVPLLEPRQNYPDTYRVAMKRLWDDAGVQAVMKHGTDVSIPDSML